MTLNLYVRDVIMGFCIKLLNSTVVIGLYFGFLTTASIGPSYVLLIRARVMEKGSTTEIAATTGFITGRLIMFISIYYGPFYLALNRPHTLTFIMLPYLVLNYVHKNSKHYYMGEWGYDIEVDSEYKNPNSTIRHFRTYNIFLNHLGFQLLNPYLFPTSILIRLMHMYLFRSNNKLLFLTSSFVGWLIGHILLMKCIGIVLIWFKQKNSIKSKITKRFDKYILLQLRNYMGQIFVVFTVVLLLYQLGKLPLPYIMIHEMVADDEKNLEEIEVAIDAQTEETNQEDITQYLSENEKTSNNINTKIVPVERPLVNILFDYQRWNMPLRYIKSDHFDRVVRDENSQFFFQTCESDGKKRISFTYPPHISNFLTMMEKKMNLFKSDDKISYNFWSSINQKKNQLSKELFQRAKLLDKKGKKKIKTPHVLENRIRLSDDRGRKRYLPKIYDPFLSGPLRGESQNSISPIITNETDTTNPFLINKIHGLLLGGNTNGAELEQKIDKFDRKLLVTEIGFFFNLMSKFSEKSVSSFHFDEFSLFPEHEQKKIYSEEKKRKRNFLFDAIRTYTFNHIDYTIFNRKVCREIKEISKYVPRWSYELVDDYQQILYQNSYKDTQITCEQVDRQLLCSFNKKAEVGDKSLLRYPNLETLDRKNVNDIFLMVRNREPDSDRELIRGSVRAQRRKTATSKIFQEYGHINSPLFLGIRQKYPFFLFFLGDLFEDLSQYWKESLRKPGTDNSEFLAFQKKQEAKEIEDELDEAELRRLHIEEEWESILYGLVIRNFVILFQSMFRKYILLPSLIITKNIIRMLLFQNPEWSEDFQDWKTEMHFKCNYQGFPTPDNSLPPDWYWGGLQIRILFPFVLKAWHNKPKVRSTKKKQRSTEKISTKQTLWYLTGYGTLVESYLQPHVPNPFLFLGPAFKQIRKQLRKDLITWINRLQKLDNQTKKKRKKEDPILLEELKELKEIENKNRRLKKEELSEIQKNSPISKSNPMIEESLEKRIKELNVQTNTILKELEKMTEEKKDEVITDAKRFELLIKNRLKIFKRRQVRLIRKSYCFFQIFMETLYINILSLDYANYIEYFLTSNIVQRYLNVIKLTKKIINKSIYNKKKNEQSGDKTNPSIIPFMSILDDKPWNITHMNSEKYYDVSSLSQAYVLFKLSQMQVSNGSNYKLRSIFDSHGRSFFLKKEIKDYFFRIQGGKFNSKLTHQNRADSIMNQWTNWLKIHYQYVLPQSAWSRLVPQKWRKKIHEHRVAQNKDLLVDDSSKKTLLIVSKKQKADLEEEEKQVDLEEKQVNLLKLKKKIKKQYGYDIFSYQYINYTDKKKSYIYGYNSPSYNTPKNIKELFDIMGDSFIQNYLDGILDEKNANRKYFHWMGMTGKRRTGRRRNGKRRMAMNGKRSRRMNEKRKTNSITNDKLLTPTFGFFSKISAYKKNPWILPIDYFFRTFYAKKTTDRVKLSAHNKAYAGLANRKLYLKKYYSRSRSNIHRYRRTPKGEKNFLTDRFSSFLLEAKHFDADESISDLMNLTSIMDRCIDLKKFLISSIKTGDLDLESLVHLATKHTCYSEYRDIEELRDNLFLCVEPCRSCPKNYDYLFIYQTISISLKHKRKILKKNSEKSPNDKNHYDLLIPEHLLSTRRRRELRILTCLNPRNRKTMDRNTINEKEINNSSEVFTKKKDLDSDTKKLMNLKFFLWPNYRFEDLACMNRYWFDTHNGSRFSLLRIRMYPPFKI